MTDLETCILIFLREFHKGKDHPCLIRRMAILFDQSDYRIRQTLRSLNMQGYPVVTSTITGGAYYASSPEEVDRYMASLGSRATKILARMRALDKAKAREFIGKQMEMF